MEVGVGLGTIVTLISQEGAGVLVGGCGEFNGNSGGTGGGGNASRASATPGIANTGSGGGGSYTFGGNGAGGAGMVIVRYTKGLRWIPRHKKAKKVS